MGSGNLLLIRSKLLEIGIPVLQRSCSPSPSEPGVKKSFHFIPPAPLSGDVGFRRNGNFGGDWQPGGYYLGHQRFATVVCCVMHVMRLRYVLTVCCTQARRSPASS